MLDKLLTKMGVQRIPKAGPPAAPIAIGKLGGVPKDYYEYFTPEPVDQNGAWEWTARAYLHAHATTHEGLAAYVRSVEEVKGRAASKDEAREQAQVWCKAALAPKLTEGGAKS